MKKAPILTPLEVEVRDCLEDAVHSIIGFHGNSALGYLARVKGEISWSKNHHNEITGFEIESRYGDLTVFVTGDTAARRIGEITVEVISDSVTKYSRVYARELIEGLFWLGAN